MGKYLRLQVVTNNQFIVVYKIKFENLFKFDQLMKIQTIGEEIFK